MWSAALCPTKGKGWTPELSERAVPRCFVVTPSTVIVRVPLRYPWTSSTTCRPSARSSSHRRLAIAATPCRERAYGPRAFHLRACGTGVSPKGERDAQVAQAHDRGPEGERLGDGPEGPRQGRRQEPGGPRADRPGRARRPGRATRGAASA